MLYSLGFNPILSEWLTTADQLTIPAFIVDVVRDSSNWGGWQLSRASFLFPDAFSYLILYFFSGDRFLSLVEAALPVLVGWVYLLYFSFAGTGWSLRLRSLWALGVGLGLPIVLLEMFPDLNSSLFKFQFSFANHFSCYVVSVIALWLSGLYFETRQKKYFYGLLFFLFLGGTSNRLVWIFYFAPMLVASAGIFFRKIKTQYRFLGHFWFFSFLSIYLGYRFETTLERSSSMPYELSFKIYFQHLVSFVNDLGVLSKHLPFLLFLIFAIVVSVLSGFRSFRLERENSTSRRFLFVALSLGIGINILAAILAWESAASLRYLIAFFWSPMILLGFLVSEKWQKISAQSFLGLSMALLLMASLGMGVRRAQGSLFAEERRNALEIAACTQEKGYFRGLANYWYAKNLRFLSEEKLNLTQINENADKDHLLFYWANNLFSYRLRDENSRGFDFVYGQSLNPQILKEAFGPPHETFICAGQRIYGYNKPDLIFSNLMVNGSQLFEKELRAKNETWIPVCAFPRPTLWENCILTLTLDERVSLEGLTLNLPSGTYRLSWQGTLESAGNPQENTLEVNFPELQKRQSVTIEAKTIQFELEASTAVQPQIHLRSSQIRIESLKVERLKL